MKYSKLSATHRLTIPKPIRDLQNWQAGQSFALIPKGKGLLIIPLPTLDDIRGMATGADPSGFRDRSDRV